MLEVSGVREWFRWYKTPDGVLNSYVHEHLASTAETMAVLQDAHADWRRTKELRAEA